MSGVIAQRYARALMNLAVQGDTVEAVAGELDDLADAMLEAPQLSALLADTRVSRAQAGGGGRGAEAIRRVRTG